MIATLQAIMVLLDSGINIYNCYALDVLSLYGPYYIFLLYLS